MPRFWRSQALVENKMGLAIDTSGLDLGLIVPPPPRPCSQKKKKFSQKKKTPSTEHYCKTEVLMLGA